MSAPGTRAGPRAAPLLNRFPGNVRKDLLVALLASLWASFEANLADPVRVTERKHRRTVTFMGAARFSIDTRWGRIKVSELQERNAELVFVGDNKPTVIDLPARLNGFWLDAFLAPWQKWLRLLGKLRRVRAVPRALAALFSHDTYNGLRTEEGDRVRFRGVLLQPGVLRAILDEGERRLANGSHKRFIEEDLIEILTWLEAENPRFDKNQLRQGWNHLASRAVAWRVEREERDTLKDFAWESLLPEMTIGKWRIVPLTDAWQLRREALKQRHCADQYLEACLAGTSRLFSVRDKGRSVATIGIECSGKGWSDFGFRGFANQPVPEAMLGLEDEVARRYADLWASMAAIRPKIG